MKKIIFLLFIFCLSNCGTFDKIYQSSSTPADPIIYMQQQQRADLIDMQNKIHNTEKTHPIINEPAPGTDNILQNIKNMQTI